MGVDVFLVYVHSAICETYLVQQYSIDLLSLKLWGGDVDVSSVYVHSAICETYLVYWYSIDRLFIWLGCTCILHICAFCYM